MSMVFILKSISSVLHPIATESFVKDLNCLASFLSFPSGTVRIVQDEVAPSLTLPDGNCIRGLVSVAKYLVKTSNQLYLLGNNDEERALINQWTEFRTTRIDRRYKDNDSAIFLKELNEYLADKVYFVGHHLTLADILLYQSLHHSFEQLAFHDKEQLQHLSRWFNQVQHVDNIRQDRPEIHFARTQLYAKSPRIHL